MRIMYNLRSYNGNLLRGRGRGVSGVIFPGALLPGRFSSRGDFLRDDFLRDDFLRDDFPPVAIFSGVIFL